MTPSFHLGINCNLYSCKHSLEELSFKKLWKEYIKKKAFFPSLKVQTVLRYGSSSGEIQITLSPNMNQCFIRQIKHKYYFPHRSRLCYPNNEVSLFSNFKIFLLPCVESEYLHFLPYSSGTYHIPLSQSTQAAVRKLLKSDISGKVKQNKEF